MHVRAGFGAAALIACLASSGAARAQSAPDAGSEPVAPSSNALRTERLKLTLTTLAGENSRSTVGSIVKLGVGAGLVGVGSWLAFSKDADEGSGVGRGFAIIFSLAGGGTYLAQGLFDLSGGKGTDELRLAKFESAERAGALSEVELARYEAELESEADLARAARKRAAVTHFGVAAGGIGLFALGAAGNLHGQARELVFIEGSGLIVIGGALGAYTLLRQSASEREWQNYRSGAPTQASNVRWQMAPVITPNVAGLSVVGQF